MNQILVIRGGAIGDFILTLPAIGLLRRAYPNARLEILGYKHIVALAENRFYADAVRSIEYGALASFFARGAELPADLADYFSSFDLVVSYLFDPDLIFQKNVERCGVENFLVGPPTMVGNEHAAQQLARPLAELDLVLTDCASRVHPNAMDREFARASFPAAPMIALHPGSGSARKNWAVENWMALIEALRQTRTEAILLVGGEADGEALARLRAAFPDLAFAENLELPKLAAVLESCALFIGHDSGISHLAAAVGTRALLLFGPSDPGVWAPANANVCVLRAGTGRMVDLGLSDVLAVLRGGGAATSGRIELLRVREGGRFLL